MKNGKGSTTKKQHFVPEFYLDYFSEDRKCFVYNPYTHKIARKKIDEICYQNQLYEIKSDDGHLLFKEKENGFENALQKTESCDGALIKKILERVKKSKEDVFLTRKEKEDLIGFVILTILRNPLVRDVIQEAYKESTKKEISTKEEITFAWLYTMTLLDKIPAEDISYEVRFLEGLESEPFITSSFPIGLKIASLDYIYMPLSDTVAIELLKTRQDLSDNSKCKKVKLKQPEIEEYNSLLPCKDSFLICKSEKPLMKYVDMMDNYDRSVSGSFIKANLELMASLPENHFLRLITNYIEEEIQNNNIQYSEIVQELASHGIEYNDAIRKMAEAVEEEFRREVLEEAQINASTLLAEMKKNL